MNLKSKWMAAAGAIMVVGALGAGVAMASTGAAPTAPAASGSQQAHKTFSVDQLKAKLDAEVKAGKLTQGQEDVKIQLATLRQDAMTKLQADEKAAIDAAVQSGKITQAQATQLALRGGHGGHERGGQEGSKQGGSKQGRGGGFFGKNMTADQVKAKLDAAVKAGKLTQAQADQMLQKWTAEQAAHASQAPSQTPTQTPSQGQGA